MFEPPPKMEVQQLFDTPAEVSSGSSVAASHHGGTLPNIGLRPNSSSTSQQAQAHLHHHVSSTLPSVHQQQQQQTQQQPQPHASRVRSAGLTHSATAAATATFSATTGNSSSSSSSKKYDFPLTPSQALEKYKRVLSTFEHTEILKYPQVYFLGPLARKVQAAEGKGPNFGFDDDKGRYKCVKNDHIAYRYEVLKGLGKGSFGDVVKAYDHKNKTHTALKIIRNEKRFHKQGQIEVKVLEHLKRLDKRNSHSVIHVQDFFLFRDHLCITFELLHHDLYTALKKDNFKGFRLDQVKSFATSVLSCLRLLRRNRIIHCDLKPENILLCGKSGDEVKVIDFGSACFDHQKIHSYIQSRFYRSPEVILGMSYTTAIDMWSLGCILCELITGHPLFPGRDEKEQLMLQMEILGIPPEDLLERGKRRSVFFDSVGNPRCLTDRKGRTHLPGTKSVAQAVGISDPDFVDFVQRCLTWDPSQRITPREASHHPWIVGAAAAAAAAAAASASASASQTSPTKLSRRRSSGAETSSESLLAAAAALTSSAT